MITDRQCHSKLKDILKNVNNIQDKIFISHIIDKQLYSYEHSCFSFTDFCDPYERSLCTSLLTAKNGFNIAYSGGYDNAERVIGIIGFEGFKKDFTPDNIVRQNLTCLKVVTSSDRLLSHRDYLGSLMGIGIERYKFGDIIVKDTSESTRIRNTEQSAFIVSKTDVADFVKANFDKVSNARAIVSETTFEELYTNIPKPVIKKIIVSSMRLDCIISSAYNCSRSEAQEYIKAKRVFVNWRLCGESDKKIYSGDMINLRGKGRLHINEPAGMTKKDRIVIEAEIFN